MILAQCGALLEDETLTDRQKEQIDLIRKKASGMAEMISELLFLSRADEGRQTLHKERLNLSELTEMAVEEQKLLAEEKGLCRTFELQIAPEVYARADESYYIRLLVNLLENAVYYGKENGVVRFYRADSARSTDSHSGLGLSMVKWIVEAHGGTIRAESRLGEGTRFIFEIPE